MDDEKLAEIEQRASRLASWLLEERNLTASHVLLVDVPALAADVRALRGLLALLDCPICAGVGGTSRRGSCGCCSEWETCEACQGSGRFTDGPATRDWLTPRP